MATTYSINTALNGKTCTLDYWPDGQGQQWPGYVTSLAQYRSELRDSLSDSTLRLYVITSTGHSELIDSDHDLASAVESLPNGGVLSVTAIARHKRSGRQNRRRYTTNNSEVEWNATATWYDDHYEAKQTSSDTESDSDESSNDDEHDAPYVPTARNKVRAIMKRFDYTSYTSIDDDDYYHATWEGDAPSGTLQRDDEHSVQPEVAHLQYILTRLGYMPLSATKQLVGSYQSNTESAVRKFRQAYSINGGDMSVYNRKTAKKLGQVVRHLRAQGHNYL